MRITADIANNSIIVYASEENYRIIERALNQLDRPKLQVAIDVTIAEVTLNDELSYGVQFFLDNRARLDEQSTTATDRGRQRHQPQPAGLQLRRRQRGFAAGRSSTLCTSIPT